MGTALARRSMDVGGRRMSYRVRDGQPCLVLIPGSHQDSRQWDETVRGLGPGLGLVILELPGHGQSAELPADPSIESYSLDSWQVLDACGIGHNVYVGGHSLGGMVALEMGRVRPGDIKGIISVEGWTNCAAAEDAFAWRMYDTLSPKLLARQDELRAKATGHLSEEERRRLSEVWTRWDGSEFLDETELPILELWGDRGKANPGLARLHIPARENICVKWFQGASHNLPLERPAELAGAIVEFIARVEAVGCPGK